MLVLVLAAGQVVAGEAGIGGRSAARWTACTTWVTNPPARYAVADDGGVLLFTAEGPGTEMPWRLVLDGLGLSGDERYLLVRYRATGLAAAAGNYFVHGEEGTVGGRLYAGTDSLRSDGEWHTLAVDLVAIDPAEVTHAVALKVIVAGAEPARLSVERIWTADNLPAAAEVAPLPTRRQESAVTVDWPAGDGLTAEPGWTPTPATDIAVTPVGQARAFSVRNPGRGMRWRLSLPTPVDLAATPYLSVRYRVTGQPAATTYAIWLGDSQSGQGKHSTIPLAAHDLAADGAWHRVCTKIPEPFVVTELAVGLDCAGAPVEMTLDPVSFTSGPKRWRVVELLPHERRDAAWPAGRDGFVAEPVRVTGGKPSPFLVSRLGASDWFDTPHVSVNGVPFEVTTDVARVPQTATAQAGALVLPLGEGVREVYLLVANTAPPTEPWGLEWRQPRVQERLDVPEKVVCEVRYERGPAERVLPLDAGSGQWGMARGLGVCVVHPDASRRATELVLDERMQTAGFAILAATAYSGAPRVSEPGWEHLVHAAGPPGGLRGARAAVPDPQRPSACAGVLQATFDTAAGLRWSSLSVAGLAGGLACGPEPVFEVAVGGQPLDPAGWAVEKRETAGAGVVFELRNPQAALAARLECLPASGNELRLGLRLTNTGAAATTVTVCFPVLRGVRLGSVADTAYLCGRRGGIIHNAEARFREGLGDAHPTQVDGFFSPASGLALACLTRDTVAQHHFANLAKTAAGGTWYPEYVGRDLGPGASWTATDASLIVREGDWRAILSVYREWLATWFRPAVPRQAWFERVFAMASDNVHHDLTPAPQRRGAVRPGVEKTLAYIGHCDLLHLYGWAASPTHGEWGDYDHYDETVGGLEYFRGNIRKVQEEGTPVSLYLDAYLSSEKGQAVGAHAREWAMKRADGSPAYVESCASYNQCPYLPGWQEHLVGTYRRVRNELQPKVLYIDEYGATDGRWTCYARDHGHSGCEVPYAGEVAMIRRLREAVGPDVVLFTEYAQGDVCRQYTDGSYTYQALWSADQERLSPHFIDLPRFVMPDFKQMHIIHYVPLRAGNWWLLKFPFFNGEAYAVGLPNLGAAMDEASLAFLKRAIGVQCAHRDAFAAADVEPLVATAVPGVFANRFSGPQETVWTLYNANGRSVSRPVLGVEHRPGARYQDAWNGVPLEPELRDGRAWLAVDLGPKSVGCVVHSRTEEPR